MSSVVISGDTSGAVTLNAPAVAGSTTLTLPTTSGTLLTTASTTGANGSAISTGVVAEAYGGTGTSTGYYGFKNRIINGAMMIDQRNVGASVTPANNATTYTVDRFKFYVNQASKLTAQQSTVAPAGFTNSLLITSSSAYSPTGTDIFNFEQTIEGFNVADLGWGTANAQPITISFWVRSSITGTFGGALLNSAQNRSYPFTYVINAANTWEQKAITIAGDTTGTWLTNNGAGLTITLSMGAGTTYRGTAGTWAGTAYYSATGAVSLVATSGATFYITGYQLEKGSTATSFDYRPYGTELALCQRYFEKSFSYEVAPAHNTGGFLVHPNAGSLGCGGNCYYSTRYQVQKRNGSGTWRFYDPLASHANTENWWRYITACNTGTAVGPNTGISVDNGMSSGWSGYMQGGGTGVASLFHWTYDNEL